MTDIEYMNLAIALAKATQGQTSPNPSVGAVIVKDGQLIATGVHIVAGGAHAEINAIKAANHVDLSGATLYITLEPCCHVGKTSACTDAIIKNKFKRVVIASYDKNPLVAGGGVSKLKNAGVEVEVGVCEAEAVKLNQQFFHFITTKLPYITIKSAVSLNGKLATASYQSKWITSSASREDAQFYRHTHDAILVGVNTVIHDNPLLSCRLDGCTKSPTRIILDTKLQINDSYNVVSNCSGNTIIVTGATYNTENAVLLSRYSHVSLIHLTTLEINLSELLPQLAQMGITSILVEGGAKVQSSFIEAGLFNQIVLYVAPKLIGGINAPGFFDSLGFNQLTQAIKLDFTAVEMLGADLKIVAMPAKRQG
jgi:diaminohydroxyphosphoribosylaminopyrimidine deaminase/5-amino-6-(5-phosphoribosylamino)uracil reductase